MSEVKTLDPNAKVRQVEITEVLLKDGVHDYHQGDRITISVAKAAEWIRLGWAKCVVTGEQNERKPGAQAIHVHDSVQSVAG